MHKVAASPKSNHPKTPDAEVTSAAAQEAEAGDTIDPTVADVADYIGQIAGEIAFMARDAKLDMLAYFLTMARMEAELIARQSRLKDELLDRNPGEWGTWPSEPRRR